MLLGKIMKRIYEKDFKYCCADLTDIRKTFKRIRNELKQQQEQAREEEEERAQKVTAIKRRG